MYAKFKMTCGCQTPPKALADQVVVYTARGAVDILNKDILRHVKRSKVKFQELTKMFLLDI